MVRLPELERAQVLVRVEEALKFLTLAFYSEGNIPVVQEIDDIWFGIRSGRSFRVQEFR